MELKINFIKISLCPLRKQRQYASPRHTR